MLIDCDTCIARGPGCGDCVVSVFLTIAPHRPVARVPARRPEGGPAGSHAAAANPAAGPARVELDEAERQAVQALAAAGLVPPLRLVSGMSYDVQDIA